MTRQNLAPKYTATETAIDRAEATTRYAPPHAREGALIIMEGKAAEMLSLSVRTLQRLRVDGSGPPHIQLGLRRIGYRMADLEAWLASRRRVSSSTTSVARWEAA